MSGEISPGGLNGGSPQTVRLNPGPAREGLGDDLFVVYADECFINARGVCVRNDRDHRSLPIPADRWWSCPAHPDGEEITDNSGGT